MKKIFVLVWVHRGFVQEPEFFQTSTEAIQRMDTIKKEGFNADYDEINIFEKLL
jgi:hypothetical protein